MTKNDKVAKTMRNLFRMFDLNKSHLTSKELEKYSVGAILFNEIRISGESAEWGTVKFDKDWTTEIEFFLYSTPKDDEIPHITLTVELGCGISEAKAIRLLYELERKLTFEQVDK